MKWILVYIVINNGLPIAVNGAGPNYYYNTMTECFWAREKLQKEIASEAMHSVYFPIGKQAICMRFEQ